MPVELFMVTSDLRSMRNSLTNGTRHLRKRLPILCDFQLDDNMGAFKVKSKPLFFLVTGQFSEQTLASLWHTATL
jgi:hypothetical protein